MEEVGRIFCLGILWKYVHLYMLVCPYSHVHTTLVLSLPLFNCMGLWITLPSSFIGSMWKFVAKILLISHIAGQKNLQF